MTKLILRQTVTPLNCPPKSIETDYTELGRNKLIQNMQAKIQMSGISALRLRQEGVCEIEQVGGVQIKYEIIETDEPEGPEAA